MRLSRRILPLGASICGAILLLSTVLYAADTWTDAANELATKILDRMPTPHAMALTVRNMSSLSDDDVAQIRRALRAQVRSRGVRLTGARQASVEVQVTLSENVEGLLWVAEIRKGTSNEVVMLTVARPKSAPSQAAEPVSLRKARIFERADPMLDIFPLENNPADSAGRWLILGLEDVSLYENPKDGSGWKLVQTAAIPRPLPWSRDPRGRLVAGQSNSFDVYLPGQKCSGSLEPLLRVDCHESPDPWPLNAGGPPVVAANFAVGRNYFEGGIRFADGRTIPSPPFFSAAALPFKIGTLWLLAALDNRTLLMDSIGAVLATLGNWGSEVASIQTGCQQGWLILADQAVDISDADSVQLYAFANSKVEPVSAPDDFAGPIDELRSLPDGSAAIAISRNLKTNHYEASRLSIACGQ